LTEKTKKIVSGDQIDVEIKHIQPVPNKPYA